MKKIKQFWNMFAPLAAFILAALSFYDGNMVVGCAFMLIAGTELFKDEK